MEKEIIKNREGLKIIVQIEEVKNSKGLVFVMHGLGCFKEQHQMEAIAKAFRDNKFTVIRFDTTNSIGESGGKLEDASITGYYQDLEDVINWSKSQKWYQEPFFLAGHSVGGYCVARYTINYPERVKAVAPFSAFVSGRLFSKTKEISPLLEKWKNDGIREWESTSRPGFMKRLKYEFMEDAFTHNLLEDAGKITCPVLLVVGEEDETIPVEDQKLLYAALKSEKELHIIKNSGHTFRGEQPLRELEDIINKWIKAL